MPASPLKILHVFSTFAIGGQQRRFAQMAYGLDGYSHLITAMDGDYGAMALLKAPERCTIREVEIAKGGFLDRGNIRRLRALIRAEAPDLVCTYNWGSLEAVIANRQGWLGPRLVPHLHFEDGFGPDETAEKQHLRRVLARRLFLRGADVIVPSRVLEQVALKRWKLPRGQVIWQPNGVDLDLFMPVPRTDDKVFRLGFIGALRPEKNLPRLLEAFHELTREEKEKKIELLIAGEGPEREALEKKSAQLGLEQQVIFAGGTDKPEDFYRQLDVFVLSSDTEQMPISLLEAMACGLPVVATDVGDIAGMVAEENRALISPPGNGSALSLSLARLLDEPSECQRLGQANRRKAETGFGLGIMISAYDRLFRERANA